MNPSDIAKQLGRQGGLKTVEKYGPAHMTKIGKMGGRPRKDGTDGKNGENRIPSSKTRRRREVLRKKGRQENKPMELSLGTAHAMPSMRSGVQLGDKGADSEYLMAETPKREVSTGELKRRPPAGSKWSVGGWARFLERYNREPEEFEWDLYQKGRL